MQLPAADRLPTDYSDRAQPKGTLNTARETAIASSRIQHRGSNYYRSLIYILPPATYLWHSKPLVPSLLHRNRKAWATSHIRMVPSPQHQDLFNFLQFSFPRARPTPSCRMNQRKTPQVGTLALGQQMRHSGNLTTHYHRAPTSHGSPGSPPVRGPLSTEKRRLRIVLQPPEYSNSLDMLGQPAEARYDDEHRVRHLWNSNSAS
ncbi:hypothetical protein F4808DRAFT_133041 [Astrocystis sublimbata]|nr:hypothetical protein F4808DRAFT_133041 [Astrocystis sublimbata]